MKKPKNMNALTKLMMGAFFVALTVFALRADAVELVEQKQPEQEQAVDATVSAPVLSVSDAEEMRQKQASIRQQMRVATDTQEVLLADTPINAFTQTAPSGMTVAVSTTTDSSALREIGRSEGEIAKIEQLVSLQGRTDKASDVRKIQLIQESRQQVKLNTAMPAQATQPLKTIPSGDTIQQRTQSVAAEKAAYENTRGQPWTLTMSTRELSSTQENPDSQKE